MLKPGIEWPASTTKTVSPTPPSSPLLRLVPLSSPLQLLQLHVEHPCSRKRSITLPIHPSEQLRLAIRTLWKSMPRVHAESQTTATVATNPDTSHATAQNA